jgi:hypothetical protein
LGLQTKLKVNEPGDIYEQEADRIADQVVATPAYHAVSGAPSRIQRFAGRQTGRLDGVPSQAEQLDGGLDVGAAIAAIQGGGTPLSNETRSYFEPRFGHDFGQVRVYAGSHAADGADAVCARAYTIGSDIAFASGAYMPWAMEGRRLLAHELAHVVQQGYAPLANGRSSNSAGGELAPHAAASGKRGGEIPLFARPLLESPLKISRQDTTPRGPSDKQGTGNKREETKKLLKDPCFGEPIDDSKARCQFSSGQLTIVRIAREHAIRRCSVAIAAINMPGNENEVKRIAKDYFHLNIRLSTKTKRTLIDKINTVSDALEHAPIECRTCQDENCNRGLIAFADARTLIALCPVFFHDEIHKVYLTPRYLIHEAGHLAGLATPTRDEMYCDQGATKEDKCPVVDAFHNVDAWSHFIEELAFTI